MNWLNSLLADPSSVTFTALFIGLFVYVMKKNEAREEHYRTTIKTLSESLNECETAKIKLANSLERV